MSMRNNNLGMRRLIAASTIAASMVFAGTMARGADSPENLPNDAGSAGIVNGIKVLPDKAPDCSSLKSIVATVTRGCTTNDARAIAIYNFMLMTHYHCPYAVEDGGIPAIKEINCYGWGLCGGTHAVQSALWHELGWNWRFIGWPGHTTVEAEYDGRWHYLDAFLKIYAWMPDGKGGRTIAGEYDLKQNPKELLQNAFVLDRERNVFYAKDDQFTEIGDKVNWRAHDFLSCGDTLTELPSLNRMGPAESWGGYNHATGNYSTDVNLAPGMALTNTWDTQPGAWYWEGSNKQPAHSCSAYKDTRNDPGYGLVLEPYIDSKPARSYGNGVLTFAADFSNDAVLKSFAATDNVKYSAGALVPATAGRPASVVVKLSSPYILTKASGEAAGADKVEVSVDGGKSFKPIDLKNFDDAIKGRLEMLVKLSFGSSLKSLKINAIVQNNPGALPYLSPGRNIVSVSVADPKALGDDQLVVTYAYRLGSRSKSFEQLCEQGKEVAKQHDAKWSTEITYVRKTFKASDLPAKFEIACPTPKGRYPVYPRMQFLRREVISSASSPAPLPDGAVEAKLGPDDELASLPMPLLIGTESAPAIQHRSVKTVKIPLAYIEYISEKGEVGDKGSLRWPKNAAEIGKVVASAVILDGDLKDSLPAKKKIAAARLCIPVTQAHDKAQSQLGAVLLKKLDRERQGLQLHDAGRRRRDGRSSATAGRRPGIQARQGVHD